MSIKYFCDACGGEIPKDQTGRVVRKLERITVEVLVAVDGVWNDGNVCKDCIVLAVANGKDKQQ